MIKLVHGTKVRLDYKEINRYDKYVLYQVYKLVERQPYTAL